MRRGRAAGAKETVDAAAIINMTGMNAGGDARSGRSRSSDRGREYDGRAEGRKNDRGKFRGEGRNGYYASLRVKTKKQS